MRTISILATGATERSLAFVDNDRPGVMLASAIQTYINRFGVAPGSRIVFAGAHDGIYENAFAAAEAGLHVTIFEARGDVNAQLLAKCDNHNIVVMLQTVPVKVIGRAGVVGVEYGTKEGDVVTATGKVIACDILGVSGGYTEYTTDISSRGKALLG